MPARTSKILPRSAPLARATPMKARRSVPRRTLAVHESAWLDAVRSIECCVRCGKFGVEAAHADIDKGASMKTDDCTAAALCSVCHFEIGNGKTLDREARRAEMDRCLRLTLVRMVRAGKVGAL